METHESPNRRGGDRTSVELWVDEIHEGALYFQRATNLSLGGLYLDRTLPHPPGTRITLALRLPDGEDEGTPMRVEAVVVEAPRELGMGVRFMGMTQAQRIRVANYLLAHVAYTDDTGRFRPVAQSSV